MSDRDVERVVASLRGVRAELRDEFVASLRAQIREEVMSGTGSPSDRTDVAQDPLAAETGAGRVQLDDLPSHAPVTVLGLEGSDHTYESNPRKHRGTALAVAAAILLVVGVGVVTDRGHTDVETEPVSSESTSDVAAPLAGPDPTPLPEVAGPPPSATDGLGYRWSRLPDDDAVFGGERRVSVRSLTAGGPGLVAVGSVGNVAQADAAVWTSVDGMTWSRVPHDDTVFGGEGVQEMNHVVAGGPGLVAVGGPFGGDGVVWTSVDGLDWRRVSGDHFVGGLVNDLVAGGPGFVAVGEDELGAAVWTSVDGLAWSRVPHDEEIFGLFGHNVGYGNGMSAVTVGGPGLVAVGSNGLLTEGDPPRGDADAVVWTSVDGLTWSRVSHDESVFGGTDYQAMFDVVVGGPGLVAAGANNQSAAVWTSVDGLSWSQVAGDESVFQPGYAITSLINTGKGLVAPGDGGNGWNARIWTSEDGITWARLDDDALFRGVWIFDAIIGGPGLVAVGATGGPGSPEGPPSAGVWVATPEN